MLDGDLSFMRRDAGSYVEATRVVETPIVAAVLAPGKMRIYINDLHVSLAHSHADTLRETARQMGIKVLGELVPCAGCSEAEGSSPPPQSPPLPPPPLPPSPSPSQPVIVTAAATATVTAAAVAAAAATAVVTAVTAATVTAATAVKACCPGTG